MTEWYLYKTKTCRKGPKIPFAVMGHIYICGKTRCLKEKNVEDVYFVSIFDLY